MKYDVNLVYIDANCNENVRHVALFDNIFFARKFLDALKDEAKGIWGNHRNRRKCRK